MSSLGCVEDVVVRRGGPSSVTVPRKQLIKIVKWISGFGSLVCFTWFVARWGFRDSFTYDTRRLSVAPFSAINGSDPCSDTSHAESRLESTLAFLLSCFIGCTILDHLNLLVPVNLRFPISVIMFIFGILMGATFANVFAESDTTWRGHGFDNFISGVHNAARFNPHALLYVILPPLLYESASSMKWHVLRKVLPSALLLAGPGVLINTLLTGFFVYVSFKSVDGLNVQSSMLLASILSATDPVAVVAALAALGAPAKLSALVEGESLLNDGSAVVLFLVFKDWVVATSKAVTAGGAQPDNLSCPGDPPSTGCVLGYFCKVAFGGACIGILAGTVLFYWIRLVRTRHSVNLELSLVLIAVYGCFFLAESLHVSGVLADVALGIVMTANINPRMSHEGRHAHHVLLAQIGYTCNQITFFAAGIISARFMWTKSGCSHDYTKPQAWLELIVLYFMMHVTRATVVAMFFPLLQRWGYGIKWKEAVILVYGGLRGAVGLIMGLIVEHNKFIDPAIKQMIAFHVSGIVFLTLFVNGCTVDELYTKLAIYPANAFRETHLRKVLTKLENECQKSGIKRLAKDWFFADNVMLMKIMRCVPKFSNIQFSLGGLPMPSGVADVKQALVGLEFDANQFRHNFAERRSDSFKDEYSLRWQRRKETRDKGLAHFVSRRGMLTGKKDQIYNVGVTGASEIEFLGAENPSGLYVSSKPLKGLRLDETGHKFKMKVCKCEGVNIIVGLVANANSLLGENARLCDTRQVLGITPSSFGFQCSDGLAKFHGPEGVGEAKLDIGCVRAGDSVSIKMQRRPSSDWEVSVAIISRAGTAGVPATCSFGSSTPDKLYPAVEFQSSRDTVVGKKSILGSLDYSRALSSKSGRSDGVEGAFADRLMLCSGLGVANDSKAIGTTLVQVRTKETCGAEERDATFLSAPGMALGSLIHCDPPRDHEVRSTTKLSVASMNSESGRNDTKHDSNQTPPFKPVLPDAAEKSCPVWELRNSVESASAPLEEDICSRALGEVSTGELQQTPESRQRQERETNGSMQDDVARVELSFELQVADDKESICELFHVFFNTVMHCYCDMHEHGVIGEVALAWLVESVNEAIDCANLEVNHSTLEDYAKKKASGPKSSLVGRRAATLQKSFTQVANMFEEMRHTNDKGVDAASLFEPLLVEYSCLEQQIGTPSIWERVFPYDWRRARNMSYGHTRAKVEALWAFVEAHEKVMAESTTMDRYPDLVQCITKVVEEVRADLKILEEIQPRRFFYSKHGLALRIILNKRLGKLEKVIDAGWVSRANGEGLIHALQERIAQANQFFPREAECCHRRRQVEEKEVDDDAWEGLQL